MLPVTAVLLVLTLCALAVPRLMRAWWPWRAPRTAIVVWQALGLAMGVSAIGATLGVGLGPYEAGVVPALLRLTTEVAGGTPPGWFGVPHAVAVGTGLLLAGYLMATLLVCSADVLRARRHHRLLLRLVARRDPHASGALVLDHTVAAAYCLPGWHPTLVLSTGALRMLNRDQLAAVLAHERAHGRERHDLVLLPFTALQRAFPGSRLVREAVAAVCLLVEMCADDRAVRQHSAPPLVAALHRFESTAGMSAPAGAMGIADDQIAARVHRLASPQRRLSLPWRICAVAAAAMTVAAPTSLLVVPL